MISNAARVRDAMRRFIEKEIILIPMDVIDTMREVDAWQQQNLSPFGRYVGMTMQGFPYARGEYVPVEKRHTAMLEHRVALRVMGLASKAA